MCAFLVFNPGNSCAIESKITGDAVPVARVG